MENSENILLADVLLAGSDTVGIPVLFPQRYRLFAYPAAYLVTEKMDMDRVGLLTSDLLICIPRAIIETLYAQNVSKPFAHIILLFILLCEHKFLGDN